MKQLSQLLGHQHLLSAHFKRSVTHRSANKQHNERMEFLGDSVLGVIVTEKLYQQLPDASEGYLSRLRASLVNENTLAEIATNLNLGDYLQLGSGELKSGGYRRKSILADALEAVIASVFLEQGMEASKQFVLQIFEGRFSSLPTEDALKDPKSRLQEHLQSRGYPIPSYELIQTRGDAHRQEFTAACIIEDLDIRTEGISTSRRKAEQAAAKAAFAQLSS